MDENEAISMAENGEGVVIDERVIGQCSYRDPDVEEMELDYEVS